MDTVYKTDCGKIRTHNEDSCGVFSRGDEILAVVADGMGGHQAGDVASSLTLSFIEEDWGKQQEPMDEEKSKTWLEEVIHRANQHVFEHALAHKECRGMGTTIVAAYCTESFATIASVGDSRCYLINEEGIRQVTEDHSLVNELVRAGQISKQDAEYHPKKHVLLRALGTEQTIDIDVQSFPWEQGDMLLLCSDGLTNKVTDSELQAILQSDRELEAKADQLISMANLAGGEDNITLVLVMNSNGDLS